MQRGPVSAFKNCGTTTSTASAVAASPRACNRTSSRPRVLRAERRFSWSSPTSVGRLSPAFALGVARRSAVSAQGFASAATAAGCPSPGGSAMRFDMETAGGPPTGWWGRCRPIQSHALRASLNRYGKARATAATSGGFALK